MALIIIKVSLGDILLLVRHFCVKGDKQEIKKVAIELGIAPPGWRDGFTYSVKIETSNNSEKAMTIEEFRQLVKDTFPKRKNRTKA